MRNGVLPAAGLLLLLPISAAAQWASIGDMPAPRRDASSLTFQNAQGIVSVAAVAPDIIRVRFNPAKTFDRDHSYAIVNR